MTITEQEYFDRACERLRDGTGRAVGARGKCEYLTEDGCKCVVGVFIPDGHTAQRSGLSVVSLAERWPRLAGIAWPDTSDGLTLASRLQECHDDKNSWDGSEFIGESVLVDLARRYDLTYATPARPAETTTTNEGAR